MQLTVNKLNTVLSGVIGNEKYSIVYNEEIQKRLTELETKFDVAETVEEAQSILDQAKEVISTRVEEDTFKAYGEHLKFDDKSQKFFLHSNGFTSTVPLPKALADYIVEATEKNMPTAPYIKAWGWLLKNPKLTARKAEMFAKYITTTYVDKKKYSELVKEGYTSAKATELSTFNDVSITKNGLIQTYKYVNIVYKKFDTATGEKINRYEVTYDAETGEATVNLPEKAEDYSLIPPIMGDRGDAFYAGSELGHRVKVGQVMRLPSWDNVNCSDGSAGLPGLHLGGQKYIEGYGGNDRLLLNCFVNPMHIGAFTDNGDGAIRVLEYFAHSALFAANRSRYNESTYLERSNEQWKEMLAEAVAAGEEKIAKIKTKTAELSAL